MFCGILAGNKTTREPDALLGAFAKLRKATLSFVMSIRLFAWKNWALTGRILMKLGI